MTMRYAAVILLCAAGLGCPGVPAAQTNAPVDSPAPQPCAAAEFRQFDFWVGAWEVADVGGKPLGKNQITRQELGCVLVERWQSTAGGTGLSMNYYDPQARRWVQHWVGGGSILTMSGGLQGKEMILEGPLQYVAERRVTRLRGIWTPLPDGRVRQHFLESTDDGKTWTEWFDGYYRRVESR